MWKMCRKVKPSEHGEGYDKGEILGYHCSLLGRFTSLNLEVCKN
jgi:hypothetical protein